MGWAHHTALPPTNWDSGLSVAWPTHLSQELSAHVEFGQELFRDLELLKKVRAHVCVRVGWVGGGPRPGPKA